MSTLLPRDVMTVIENINIDALYFVALVFHIAH
jgi:hypothetical protein